jgi:UDP-N-acetylmuramate-alanine ligase
MKHAVRHIHFVGIGPAGVGAPAALRAAVPLPPRTMQVRG